MAPTSPALTNTLGLRLDRRLSGLARKLGWRYTRYADDLTFSLPADHQGPPRVGTLLGSVRRIVEDEGFAVHPDKTAVARRGGWDAAGVPTLEHYLELGSWFAGTPDDLVAHLKSFEERYPGMQHINLSPPLTTPKDRIVEQYRMVGELVMPHFRSRPAMQAAAAQ